MGIKKSIEQLIIRLEKTHWDLLIAIFWLASVSFTRGIFEFYLFDHGSYDFVDENYLTHKFEFNFPLFYFAVFLTASIIIKIFSGKKIAQVMKASLPFYSIIILAPIFDRLLGNTHRYYYITDYCLVTAFVEFPALTGIVFYMILLGGIYVWVSSKSIFKCIFAMISLFGLYFTYVTTFPIKIVNILSKFSSFLPLNLLDQFERECSLIELFYLIIILFSIIFVYWIHDSDEFKMAFKSHFRPWRMGQYLLMVIWGYSLIGDFQPLRVFLLFSTLMTIALAWQFAVLINDLYDQKIDMVSNPSRGLSNSPLTRKKIIEFASLCAILAIYFALSIASTVTNLIILLLAISFFYSVPPVRLKRYPFSSVFIGIASFLAFLCGHLSQVSIYNIKSNATITGLSIAIGMTLGANLIDLKDIEGDKKAGVSSIPVIFGLEKGRKIVAALVVIGYAIVSGVLFWLTKNWLFALVVLPASSMVYLLLKFENTKSHWRKIFAVHYQAIIGAILFQFIKI